MGQQVHRCRRGVAAPPGRVEQPEVEEADVAWQALDARDAEPVELHLRPVGLLVEELAFALDQLVTAVLEPQVQVGIDGLEVGRDGRGDGLVVEAGVRAPGDLLGQDCHHLLADVGEHVMLVDERAEAFDARVGRSRHDGEPTLPPMTDVETTVSTTRAGAVATLTLTRPQALNALTHEMLGELGAAARGALVRQLRPGDRAHRRGARLQRRRRPQGAGRRQGRRRLGERAAQRQRPQRHPPADHGPPGDDRPGQRVLLHRRARAGAGLRPHRGGRRGQARRHPCQVGSAADLGHEPTPDPRRRRGAGSRPVVHGPHVLGSGGRGMGPGR